MSKVTFDYSKATSFISNEEVERYINSYIRRNINDSINHERQESQLYKNNSILLLCELKNTLRISFFSNSMQY